MHMGDFLNCTLPYVEEICYDYPIMLNAEIRHIPNREESYLFTLVCITNAILASILLLMSGLVLGLGDVPLNLPQLPANSHAQKVSKHKEAECTKKAYNLSGNDVQSS